MLENKNIEAKAADAILQKPIEIEIGGQKYTAAPPSTATLILVSEAVSRLPHLTLDGDKAVEECLSIAKDCKALGDVAAIMLLGARHLTETVKEAQTVKKSHLWGLFSTSETVEIERVIDRKAELAQELLETLPPRDLNSLIVKLLEAMQLADFFGLTTFLTEVNMLRQTKVEN